MGSIVYRTIEDLKAELNLSALGMLHLVEVARRSSPDAFRMAEGVTGMKTNWCYAEENPNW